MPDKVTTPYADVATDSRSIGGQAVEIGRTDEIGASAVDPGRITVNQTGATIAARDTRKLITLLALRSNSADVDVVDAGQQVGTGFPLEPGASLDIPTTAAINLDTTVDGQVIAYVETYDA
jgi:hypothetical protein